MFSNVQKCVILRGKFNRFRINCTCCFDNELAKNKAGYIYNTYVTQIDVLRPILISLFALRVTLLKGSGHSVKLVF